MPIPIDTLLREQRPLEDRVLDFLKKQAKQAFSRSEIYRAVEGLDNQTMALVSLAAFSQDARLYNELDAALERLCSFGQVKAAQHNGQSYFFLADHEKMGGMSHVAPVEGAMALLGAFDRAELLAAVPRAREFLRRRGIDDAGLATLAHALEPRDEIRSLYADLAELSAKADTRAARACFRRLRELQRAEVKALEATLEREVPWSLRDDIVQEHDEKFERLRKRYEDPSGSDRAAERGD